MPRRTQFMTWRTRKQRKRRGQEKERRRYRLAKEKKSAL